MRILVCGGRNFGNYRGNRRGTPDWKRADDQRRFMFDALDKIYEECQGAFTTVFGLIEGGAPGADTVAGEWARANGHWMREFPADWATHGPSAGVIRNKRMLVDGQPDLVIAFPGGNGTANMIKLAKEAGVPVREIPYE